MFFLNIHQVQQEEHKAETLELQERLKDMEETSKNEINNAEAKMQGTVSRQLEAHQAQNDELIVQKSREWQTERQVSGHHVCILSVYSI